MLLALIETVMDRLAAAPEYSTGRIDEPCAAAHGSGGWRSDDRIRSIGHDRFLFDRLDLGRSCDSRLRVLALVVDQRLNLNRGCLAQDRDLADPLGQPCRRIDPRRVVQQPAGRASTTGAPVGQRQKPYANSY